MMDRDRRAFQTELVEEYCRRVRFDHRPYDLPRAFENLQRDVQCAYGYFAVSSCFYVFDPFYV